MTPARNLDWCLCGVCGGDAAGAYGWAPKPGLNHLIVCEDCWTNRHHAWSVQFRRTAFDVMARDKAGEQGGAYLEKIGVSDLAVLTPDQWATFLDTLFRARQAELRHLYSPEAPLA